MQEVQLYIQGERVSLFEDETISLTQTIQNVRDISKIFTDFSKQFNLPASAETNKIFKHYYNNDIIGGFDARYKVDASIKLNGGDYRKGKLRLNSVSLKDGKPYSYKVVFFGETVSLSDVLGDDYLRDLSDYFSDFDHILSSENTLQGLRDGWDLVGGVLTAKQSSDTDTGDLIYPFISPSTAYYYDVTEPLQDGNDIYVSNPSIYGTDKGINWIDLKPALRVRYIFDAISERYGLIFSDDFFSESNDIFNELYLWLHTEKGDLSTQVSTSSYDINLEGFDLKESDDELRTLNNTALYQSFNQYTLDYIITVVGAGLYNVKIIDKMNPTRVYGESIGLSGNTTFSVNINNAVIQQEYVYPKFIIETGGGVSEFSLDLDITRVNPDGTVTSEYDYNNGNNNALSTGLNVGSNMPKIKVIDFLTSIFKMYNLTAYIKDGVVNIKPLDDFYTEGDTIDVTKYIDVKELTVSRNDIYSAIDFEYDEPKTIFTIESNEVTGGEFGNLTYNSDNDDTFDGGRYAINIDFEKTIYERMIDNSNGVITDWSWGYFTDKDRNPVVANPLLFYATKINTIQDAYFDDGSQYIALDRYMKAGNVMGDESQTLNFNAELDEWTLNLNEESLYKNFYLNYIEGVFDVRSRIKEYTAYLPLSFLLNYTLADTLVINGKKHKINAIKTNLQTGESKLELITARNA